MLRFLLEQWQIVLPILSVLVLGVGIGGWNERRHLRSLARREAALGDIRVCNVKRIADPGSAADARLVMGHVVIATDMFKTLATSLRSLIGGEMGAAMSLMQRARREAVVRMLEEARAMGADEVWNVRFGFCSISQMRGKRGVMQVELLAYGTAVRRDARAAARPAA